MLWNKNGISRAGLNVLAVKILDSRLLQSLADNNGERSDPHQAMILLIGYSTIPHAPAVFKRGMMCRTVSSSRIVITSTHSGSDRDETVGFCKAGNTPSTLATSFFRTFIIS